MAGTLCDLRKSHSNLEIQIMVQTSGTMLSLLQEFPCCSICSRTAASLDKKIADVVTIRMKTLTFPFLMPKCS